MQCPLCGREAAELTGGLCPQCVSERKGFLHVPDVIDLVRCAHCGRQARAGGWVIVDPDRDAFLQQALPHEVDVDADLSAPQVAYTPSWEDQRNATVDVVLEGTYQGHPVRRQSVARVRLKQTACPDCSREFGGYFEAILQIRGSDDRVLDAEAPGILARVKADLDGYRADQRTGAWASKTERVRGGVDLYMGSQEVARLVARDIAERFGAEYAESSKLVGRRDGRDLVRFTLMVRLPPYRAGDFLLVDGRPCKLLRNDRKLLTLWDLERRERVQRESKRAGNLKVIGAQEEERDAVVVSFHAGRLQVLDPYSLKTVDLSVEGDYTGRETVRVFRHDENLYVVPDEGTLARPTKAHGAS